MKERFSAIKKDVNEQIGNSLAASFLTVAILGSLSLVLSPDQRRSIRNERDCNRCQFPHPVGDKCSGRLEVHHITPQRWAKEHNIPEEINDRPENLLTVCSRSHSVHIHPDMETARQNYYADKGSYKLAFENRDELAQSGEVYWNTAYDESMRHVAQRRTREATKRHWLYPSKRIRERG